MDRRYGTLAVFMAAPATLLFMVAACSADKSSTVDVLIESFKYDPDPVKVRVGDSITWTNGDPVGHTATAKDESFNTGMFFTDKSATIRFDTAGTFPYFCGTHPEMAGSIVVEPAE